MAARGLALTMQAFGTQRGRHFLLMSFTLVLPLMEHAMTTPIPMDNSSPEPQSIGSPITSSAIFIVATLVPGSEPASKVRDWCADIAALTRSVGKRVPSGNLSCICGFGSGAWDTLFGSPRPASLHGFREFGAEGRRAVATPGDICCTFVPTRWICVSSWPPN